MNTSKKVREKQSQVLTIIADELRGEKDLSRIYLLIDDVIEAEAFYQMYLKKEISEDVAYNLLDNIGK